MTARFEEFLENSNVRAFLAALRYGEGTADEKGYRRLVGGGEFEGFDKHPNKRIPITYYDTNEKRRKTIFSTAAGAYQFIIATWTRTQASLSLPDFSPRSQDIGAVSLIAGRGALSDVVAGRINEAVRKCALEWASLPGSPYGQPVKSLTQFRAYYERHGGIYGPVGAVATPAPAPAPVEAPTPAVEPPEPIYDSTPYAPLVSQGKPAMAPFVWPAITMLMESVPSLIRLFGKGEQSSKNAETAEKVIEIAKQVTGADTAEGAARRIQESPDAQQALEKEVRTNWFDLYDPEIAKANEESRKAAGDRVAGLMSVSRWNAIPWWGLAYSALIGCFFLVKQILTTATAEVQTLVLGSVLGVVSTVIAYFFGSSFRANAKVGGEGEK